MPAELQGIVNQFENAAQIRNEVHAFAINWFANRTPLVARLPRLPVGSTTFKMVGRNYRGRTAVLASATTAVAAGTVENMTLDDASKFMVGDELEITNTAGTSTERIEIQADPNTTTNVVSVKRGVSGTTPLANDLSNVKTVALIGNSRTGKEIDQTGIAFNPVGVDQYCQVYQHAVQVGGALASSTAFVLPPGFASIFNMFQFEAMQNMMDDVETTCLYGIGEAPAASNRPKQKGLRTQIVTNRTTAPTNAAAYKPVDLIRDTLEKCRKNGGNPDVFLFSPNFMTGLSVWGHAAQRIDAGVNIFGTPTKVFEAPFLEGTSLLDDIMLKPFTAVCLTSSEVRLRVKRNEYWNPRGIRGDATEGDYMFEGAIELENEAHHAWLEGITAFSAT